MTTDAAATSTLFSRDFRLVVSGSCLFFVGFGASLPVLPRFVVDELGRGDVAVGLVFAVYALAAVVVRPLIGHLGDRSGRRVLVLGGAVLTAVALIGHLAATSLAVIVLVRILAGAGQAAVIVGFATMALDLAPPHRHGEAASYVMVATQVGIGLGPLVGETLLRLGSYATVWVAAAVGSLVAGALALALPRDRGSAVLVARGLFHPAAWRPGIVLGLGVLGFIGFLAFVPLYAAELGVERVALLFLVCSGTIAVVRMVGAKLPDRLVAVPGASMALALLAVGATTIGLASAGWMLFVGTLLLAAGTAVVAPSLVLAAVQGVPHDERARVMATITMFLDIASAAGPAVLGVVASAAGYGPTFLLAGASATVALVLLRWWLAPRLRTGTRAASTGRFRVIRTRVTRPG